MTSTLLLPAGETAVIEVAELTVKLVAAVEPKRTAVAPVKLVPVMVTEVPPVEGPDTGLNALTVGAVGGGGGGGGGGPEPPQTTTAGAEPACALVGPRFAM